MAEEWEDLVIETGVDSLLNYLAENGKTSAGQIADEIGVDESRVKEWADALSEEDLVEKHHTLTSGLVLDYKEKNVEESREKKEEIEDELQKKAEEIHRELEEKSKLVEEKREELLNQKDELTEEEKHKAVEDAIARLNALESDLEEQIKKDNIDQGTLQLIAQVEKVLQEVEKIIKKHLDPEQDEKLNEKAQEAVKEIKQVLNKAEGKEELSDETQQIRRQMKTVKKLERNIKKARARNKKQDKDTGPGLIQRILSILPVKRKSKEDGDEEEQDEKSEEEKSRPSVEISEEEKINIKDFPEETYTELVDKNRVTEVMRKISLLKRPDYEKLLEAEKTNKNRKDLVEYLEERVNDVR